MFEYHANRNLYFEIQIRNTENDLIPFIEQVFPIRVGMRVLEIGCGEGGLLKVFTNRGCSGIGVELYENRLRDARTWLQEEVEQGKLSFIAKDIFQLSVAEVGGVFDLIVLKDVIEHVYNQAKLMEHLKQFLKTEGVMFIGFPPWYMPFGGHQQMLKSKWLSKLPYLHLIPKFAYKWILQGMGEDWESMLEVKATGISIERFETICREKGYALIHKTHFLINPIYQYKFGWKPKKQFGLIQKMLFIRNFFTSTVYYLVQESKS